jgi:hypothetical protein
MVTSVRYGKTKALVATMMAGVAANVVQEIDLICARARTIVLSPKIIVAWQNLVDFVVVEIESALCDPTHQQISAMRRSLRHH